MNNNHLLIHMVWHFLQSLLNIFLVQLHCKYLQPIYSHLLCYISNSNLAVTFTANGSTYDTHWHLGVQFEIEYCFGLYFAQPNYSWKRNTVKSRTEYSQDICSVGLNAGFILMLGTHPWREP